MISAKVMFFYLEPEIYWASNAKHFSVRTEVEKLFSQLIRYNDYWMNKYSYIINIADSTQHVYIRVRQ